jgi:hypothetical protein
MGRHTGPPRRVGSPARAARPDSSPPDHRRPDPHPAQTPQSGRPQTAAGWAGWGAFATLAAAVFVWWADRTWTPVLAVTSLGAGSTALLWWIGRRGGPVDPPDAGPEPDARHEPDAAAQVAPEAAAPEPDPAGPATTDA